MSFSQAQNQDGLVLRQPKQIGDASGTRTPYVEASIGVGELEDRRLTQAPGQDPSATAAPFAIASSDLASAATTKAFARAQRGQTRQEQSWSQARIHQAFAKKFQVKVA